MKTLVTRVRCVVCGKTLRGRTGILPGYYVRPHKDVTTGKPCQGAQLLNHTPQPATPRGTKP